MSARCEAQTQTIVKKYFGSRLNRLNRNFKVTWNERHRDASTGELGNRPKSATASEKKEPALVERVLLQFLLHEDQSILTCCLVVFLPPAANYGRFFCDSSNERNGPERIGQRTAVDVKNFHGTETVRRPSLYNGQWTTYFPVVGRLLTLCLNI